MRIILTHEQADFDAIASMLGASLLDEQALPVLPGRMNRNVRAFITLYGAELPFVERKDLPSGSIEAITLVDTQSMISLKGASKKTQVQVIDHHPRKPDLNPTWSYTGEELGANTTLFVEALRDGNGVYHAIHATLLLIGIYEDTGSLTYVRTTSRDLRAAAYLLEAGASLQIAEDFLNQPLSRGQQILYDRLRGKAHTHHIHGHHVVVSCADAHEMDEEFSTVAHKLRDLLDPDALFLLIKGRDGVQMIARSASDNIDVAELAAVFGGGGHSRAAAGLIHDRELEEVCAELVRILPEYVRPAITVAQIMSRGPQVLSPDTRAVEAAERMQRYGYEGYPVVSDGKVVGLLTRRSVDQSLSHKLNMTAFSLMLSGEVTVQPGDSIEHLQRLMTETSWGQVPVVDPANGQIIGIVTRTDLLKILSVGPNLNGQKNLASKLEANLPPARLSLLKAIADAAHDQHAALYLVGGFVRDLLLDRPSLDFDLVVEGDAIALAFHLAGSFGGRVTSHARFGTAKWYLGGISRKAPNRQGEDEEQPAYNGGRPVSAFGDLIQLPRFLDLISARTEFYTYPTALPTVERGSIKLDLHRRDFTINTLALRLDGHHWGELHDYWGGLSDLQQGLVRSLHSLSFVDDPTRMLRAVRFEQRFGFHIEQRTLQLLREAVSLLDRVSGDRIRHELDHILDESRVATMFSRLDELGLLQAIHPGLKWDEWLYAQIERLARSEPGLDMSQYFPQPLYNVLPEKPDQAEYGGDEGKNISWNGMPLKRALGYLLLVIRIPYEEVHLVLKRLRVQRALVNAALAACQLYHILNDLIGMKTSEVVARLEDLPMLALAATYLATSETSGKDILIKYMTEWKWISPATTGNDLRELGLAPGPLYKQILIRLRNAWLDGEIGTVEEEHDLRDRLIIDHKIPPKDPWDIR